MNSTQIQPCAGEAFIWHDDDDREFARLILHADDGVTFVYDGEEITSVRAVIRDGDSFIVRTDDDYYIL